MKMRRFMVVTGLLFPVSVWCQVAEQKPERRDFVKHLQIESLGQILKSDWSFGERSDCQVCVPRSFTERTRAVLPDFGAKATVNFWNGRLSLSGAFRGTDVVMQTGGFRFNPILFRSTSFNDDWITHADFNARFALDRAKQVSVGFTHSYVTDFGPAKGHWTQEKADLSLDPVLLKMLVVKLVQHPARAPLLSSPAKPRTPSLTRGYTGSKTAQ
jgi:hypothetical protein